jgi:tetratricopeptide (TPR) repeat protein
VTNSKTLFNPFPGLRPFNPDEDHLFFGRERETDELLRRLRSTRFLQVIGASGSGKSSLVRSGLIPALYSGFMVNASSTWRVLIFRPGNDPIGELASALNEPSALGKEGELAGTNRVLLEATLRRSSLGLVQAVRQARIPPEDNLLVVVDQFEELFRFRRRDAQETSRDEAAAFFKLLLEAAHQDQIPIYIVLTLRADFIGDCIEFQGLPEAVNAGLYLVPRMTRDELRSAITGPVAVGGGEITQRLVLRLLNDLGDNHDQLPILQHALMRTWDHWEKHREPGKGIDITDYEAVGTLQNALSMHAEEAYKEAGSERGRQIIEKMFKALTDRFSDPRGIRRPTSVRELAAISEATEPEVIQTVELFRRSGRFFLTPQAGVPLDSRSIVDLSHESLMRCWSRLITWAEEEMESAMSYLRIAQAASWCEECTGGLWTDPQLEFGLQWRRQNRPTAAWAERYDDKFDLAMAFLDNSEKAREAAREKERRRKKELQGLAIGLAVLLVAATISGYIAYTGEKHAKQNLELAKKAVDESLSSAGAHAGREAPDSPEIEQFRKELLDKAKDFYSKFTQQHKHSEEFADESAMGHSRLGDINRLLFLPEEAITEYRKAIGQFELLYQNHRGDPHYRRMLAYCHHWIAETVRLWLEKEPRLTPYTSGDAEREYKIALDIQQALQQEAPTKASYQQELARTYYNRGILRYDDKQYDLTEKDFRQAIALLEPLASRPTGSSAEDDLNQPPAAQDLARVYNNLGNLLSSKQKKYAEAAEFIEQAIALHKSLLAKNPANREYKQELAMFYNNLSAVRYNNNQIEAASEANHKAFDLIEDVIAPSPYLADARTKTNEYHQLILEEESRIAGTPGISNEITQHPRFHVLYTNLAHSYARLAREYLKFDDLQEAQNVIEGMHRILPRLTPQDRAELSVVYRDLIKELNDKKQKK